MKTAALLLMTGLALGDVGAAWGRERDPMETGRWPLYNGPIVDLALEGQHVY